MARTIGWLRCCNLIGTLVSIATLILLIVFVVEVVKFATVAPGILKDTVLGYIRTEGADMLETVVEEKLMPGMKEEMLGWIFGEGLDPPPEEEDEPKRRTAAQCPVSNPSLCDAFRETCSAFQTCRTVRDRPTCTTFIRKMNVACALNSCDVYNDKGLCNTVIAMCRMRMRCILNTTACVALESDMRNLCHLM